MAETTNNLRVLRERDGLSQATLAQAVGVSRQTINAIETGRFDPSLPLALLLSTHFGLPVEQIFQLNQSE